VALARKLGPLDTLINVITIVKTSTIAMLVIAATPTPAAALATLPR